MFPLHGALGPLGRAYNVAVAASEFLTGLLWAPSLDEVSGTRVDPVSAYDLTPTGAVRVAPRGPRGTSAHFTKANSEQLYNQNINPDWSLGITQAFWIRIPVTATVNEGYLVFGQYGPIWGGGGWLMGDSNSTPGLLSATITNSSEGKSFNWGYNINDGLWHFVVLRYDPSSKKASISVDAQTKVESAALASHPVFSPSYKELRYGTMGFLGNFMDADMARAGIWNTHKSDAEITALYNEGEGKDYADLDAGELTGLLCFHRMKELYGSRLDSSGNGYTLTDGNTVMSRHSAPHGSVAYCEAANSEYLSRANYRLPDNYTISFWIHGFDGYPGTPTNGGNIMFAGSAYPYSASCVFGNGGYFGSMLFGDGASAYAQAAGFYGDWIAYDEGPKWHFITLSYDYTTGIGQYWVDDRTAPISSTSIPAAFRSNSDVLHIGGSPVMSSYSTNRIARFSVHNKVLTSDERLSLFNEGKGKNYDELTAGDLDGLVNFWGLTERTGTRYDSHGSAHLTDNATVLSVVNAESAMSKGGVSVIAVSGQYLRTAPVSLDLSGGYTVSVWARPNAKTAGDWTIHTILEKNHTWNYTYPFALTMNGVDSSNTLYFTAACGNAAAATIQAHSYNWARPWSLYQYRWVNLVAVYSPLDGVNQLRLYVNGELAPTLGGVLAGAPFNTVAQEISLGYTTNGFAAQWTGAIDEPLIWNVPFDATQVQTLFNAGRGLFHPAFELA